MKTKRAEHMEEIMVALVCAGKPVGRAFIDARVSASGSSLAYSLKLMEDRGLVEFIRPGAGRRTGTRYQYKATAKGHAVDFRAEKLDQETNGALMLRTTAQKNPINVLAPMFMKLTFDRERDALELERFATV